MSYAYKPGDGYSVLQKLREYIENCVDEIRDPGEH